MTVIVTLSEEAVQRCHAYAMARIDPKNISASSSKASLSEKSSSDFEVQMNGRVSEYAVAQFLNLDPLQVIDWNPAKPDLFDVFFDPVRIDVKGSRHPRARYLIYSVGRTSLGLWEESKFDVLVFVRNRCPEMELVGWVSRKRFERLKFVAPDGPAGESLIAGSWYLPEGRLNDIGMLPQVAHLLKMKVMPAPFEHHCHCGRWGSWGFGVSLRNGREGKWFCFEHKPKGRSDAGAA